MASPWKRRGTRTLYESRWYNLRQDDLTLPGGEEITYTWVDHPGYSMIVPLLGDGRVVMERVYRHAPGRTLLECPSGGLDGEPSDVAARRELREETGYRAGRVEPLGSFYGSSGISNERFHLFLGTDISAASPPTLEITEQIEVELIALDKFVELARRGELTDGPSALAILLTHGRLVSGE